MERQNSESKEIHSEAKVRGGGHCERRKEPLCQKRQFWCQTKAEKA
jgi:hypothetical protein